MKTIGDIHIAGSFTTDDWKKFRVSLTPGGDPAIWKNAFEDYFHTRLSLRYLDPIKVLQDNGTFQGEGFSIVAIQCSLVEFLESTVEGKSYRFCPNGAPALGPHEYSNSRDIFVSFLLNRTPFDDDFKDNDVARDFYVGVRCGLLHEARTKNGWTIWAKESGGHIINAKQKVVYRNNFQGAFSRSSNGTRANSRQTMRSNRLLSGNSIASAHEFDALDVPDGDAQSVIGAMPNRREFVIR